MKKVIFLVSIALTLLAVLSLPANGQSQEQFACTIDLDRSNSPDLYFNNITLLIKVNDGQNFSLQTDRLETNFAQNGDEVVVTTAGNQVTLTFTPGANQAGLCETTVAPLLDNKSWAWSHGFDDNVNLRPAIDAFRAKSWPATIFIIAKEYSQTRQENWIIDEPFFNNSLLLEGWALGNHSWNHERFDTATPTEADYEKDISDAQVKLEASIARSSVPEFKIITFASPNFSGAYNIPFANEAARSDLMLQETGGDFMLAVTGTSDYTAGDITAKTLVGRSIIGRDIFVEINPQVVIDRIDWMAANKGNSGLHFWYNTLAHGNHEGSLGQIIDHVWRNYGPEGTNEAWVASSSEVYSYIKIRDSIKVNVQGLSADPNDSSGTALEESPKEEAEEVEVVENSVVAVEPYTPIISAMETWASTYAVDSQKAQVQPMMINLAGRGLQNLKEEQP